MTREPGELEALDDVERLAGLDGVDAFDGVDEVEGETVIVDRGARAPEYVDEVEGETVVVDRSVRGPAPVDAVEGETVVVDRSVRGPAPVDEVEGETVVVDRSVRGPAPVDAVEGETVVVDRGVREPDAPDLIDAETIVVDRGRADASGVSAEAGTEGADDLAAADTMVSGPRFPGDADVSAADPADDTFVVVRGRDGRPVAEQRSAADASPPESSVTIDAPVRRRRLSGRRTLEPAPLEPIDLRSSVRAVGAGAVEYYRPRQLPAATPVPEAFDAAPPAREPSPGLPSIRRSSRRVAVTTLVALTASIAVGLTGVIVVTGLLVNA